MSDSTTDTSTIDEKQEQQTTDSTNSLMTGKLASFLKSIFIFIILIIIYFSFGALVLYGCKIGQTNILPTDINCYPYEELKPEIQPIQTNIFTTFTDPQLSMKMNFPYDKYNSSNKILDLFRNYKEETKSHFLSNYFISIIESLIQFNYSSLNFVLNTLNSLPEVVIVTLGPAMVSIATTFIFLFDHLYFMYLWFAKMGWFFKSNVNSKNSSESNIKPDWKDVTVIEPVNYGLAIGLIFLFCILFWFTLPVISVLPFLTMSWCIFSGLTYKAQMHNKEVTVLNIIQDLFKYYKVTIMTILSIFVVISAFSNLGGIQGLFSILTLALIYWGIISINIFKPINQEYLSKLVSYEQAKKVCNYKEKNKEKHGLLYNLLLGQNGGGDLTKQLKKLGKK